MATTSGSSAGGGGRGRTVRRTSSTTPKTGGGRGVDEASTGEPDDSEIADTADTADAGDAGPETVAVPTTPAGDRPGPGGGRIASARSALDALAPTRSPRPVPPSPGGVLPTTRRGMLRYRVLPRSVVGVSMLILAFAIGAGFSGVVLFSYYQFRQNQADSKVNALISGYKGQFNRAEADLNAAVAAAQADIAKQLKGVQSLQAGPAQIASLLKQVAPSVYFVHTLDPSGQPAVGTAFVVSSTSTQSLLLTSYTTVTAATKAPGPPVFVSQGDSSAQTPVTVRTWDPQYDLALLILPKGGLTPLPAAPNTPVAQPGDRLYAVSGLGSAGASLTQGSVIDVSSSGLQVDASIGTPFQGGPLINQAGQVVAVGSRSYSPLGFTSEGTYFVPFVEAACSKVLTCPGGTLIGSH